ncbi:hypothetical protein ABT063_38620 [Streptomyces sp. NPDC002838]
MLTAATISLVGPAVSIVWAPETRGLARHESAAPSSRTQATPAMAGHS